MNIIKFEVNESKYGENLSYTPVNSGAQNICKLMGYEFIPCDRIMDRLYEVMDELGVQVMIYSGLNSHKN